MNNTEQSPLFDLQKTLYQSSNYTRRRLHQTRLAWVRQSIEKYAGQTPRNKAIEYGPGSGIYLPILNNEFRHVVAADVELAYLNGISPLLEKIQGLSLMQDNIMNSTISNDDFDMVLCSEVLEHVPDPKKAVATLFRIVKPGGIAVVTTPQRFSILELCCKVAFLPGVIHVVRMIYREPILETGHISLKSHKEFRQLLDDAGFTILEETKFGLYLPLIAEFAGDFGGRLIERFEKWLKQGILSNLFWTQAYVLKKPL